MRDARQNDETLHADCGRCWRPGACAALSRERISSNLHEPTGVAAGSRPEVTRAWASRGPNGEAAPGAASRRHPAPPGRVRRSGCSGGCTITRRGRAGSLRIDPPGDGHRPRARVGLQLRRIPRPARCARPPPRHIGATSKVHRGASRRRFPKRTVCWTTTALRPNAAGKRRRCLRPRRGHARPPPRHATSTIPSQYRPPSRASCDRCLFAGEASARAAPLSYVQRR